MSALARLAADAGLIPTYRDFDGVERAMAPETRAALLDAMGLGAATEPQAAELLSAREAARAARLGPSEMIVDAGSATVVTLTDEADWALYLDDGSLLAASGRGNEAAIPTLPAGVHRLELATGARNERTWLLAAPPRAPSLHELTGRERLWGVTAPLYGIGAEGLGSFDDLATLAEALADHGASFLGINPVHALGIASPRSLVSPYSPTHRGFFEPRHAPRGVGGAGADLIDYESALPRIEAALEMEFAAFEALPPDAPARAALAEFEAERGGALARFTLHEALSLLHGPDWRAWPAALRNPDGDEARRFAGENAHELRRHAWRQRRAEGALAGAQARAHAAGMALGLYLDLAVGSRLGGAESWGSMAHAHGVSMGAPPDAFAPDGQTWGLAPFAPEGLAAQGYRPFIDLIDAATRHAGMIRIDHILGFSRAFWAPGTGAPGGYVRMPMAALIAVTKIVAHRRRALVVGEDLGLAEPRLRDALADAGIFGADVMQFDWDGMERRTALASFGTHDTPTIRGWFEGADLDWRARLGQTGGVDEAHAARVARRAEFGPDPTPAVHERLANGPAALVAVQLEDLAGAREQANLPGSGEAHPNWRRRIRPPESGWENSGAVEQTAAIMAKAGRGDERGER